MDVSAVSQYKYKTTLCIQMDGVRAGGPCWRRRRQAPISRSHPITNHQLELKTHGLSSVSPLAPTKLQNQNKTDYKIDYHVL
jgi:hypothetical protein